MKDVAKTIAVGGSAALFALAVAQAQPGCDAGGTERSAPAKAEAPKEVKAEETPQEDAPPPDVKAAVRVEEPAPPPNEEPAVDEIAEAKEEQPSKPRAKPRKAKKDEPEEKVFLPATKSGAFIPRQQANAPAQQGQ